MLFLHVSFPLDPLPILSSTMARSGSVETKNRKSEGWQESISAWKKKQRDDKFVRIIFMIIRSYWASCVVFLCSLYRSFWFTHVKCPVLLLKTKRKDYNWLLSLLGESEKSQKQRFSSYFVCDWFCLPSAVFIRGRVVKSLNERDTTHIKTISILLSLLSGAETWEFGRRFNVKRR